MVSFLSKVFSTKFFSSLTVSKKVAYLSLFIAMSVVVNSFLEISMASTKITFTYFVCFFGGFLLGPLPGFLVGFLGDGIGFLLKPQDVYWFYGLTLGLFGMIAGFIRKIPLQGRGGVFGKAVAALLVNYLLITCLVNSLVNYSYLAVFSPDILNGRTFWVYLWGRLAVQTVVYAVNAASAVAVLSLFVGSRALGFFKDELSVRMAGAPPQAAATKIS